MVKIPMIHSILWQTRHKITLRITGTGCAIGTKEENPQPSSIFPTGGVLAPSLQS